MDASVRLELILLPRKELLNMRLVASFILVSFGFASIGCGGTPSSDSRGISEDAFSPNASVLSLEERMGIRARLTRIKADAQRVANEIYDPFKSRELAIANEALAQQLQVEGESALRAEYDITETDVELIVIEYLERQGVSIVE